MLEIKDILITKLEAFNEMVMDKDTPPSVIRIAKYKAGLVREFLKLDNYNYFDTYLRDKIDILNDRVIIYSNLGDVDKCDLQYAGIRLCSELLRTINDN